jgi:hypothetical protein
VEELGEREREIERERERERGERMSRMLHYTGDFGDGRRLPLCWNFVWKEQASASIDKTTY